LLLPFQGTFEIFQTKNAGLFQGMTRIYFPYGVLTSHGIEVKISFIVEYLYFTTLSLTAMPPAGDNAKPELISCI